MTKFIFMYVSVSFLCITFVFAQEEETEVPYYKLPTNRTKIEELRSIPNLIPYDITYYINMSGNFKKDYYKTSPFSLLSNDPLIELSGSYGITIGQNRNNKWFYEIGYYRYTYEVNNYIYNLNRSLLSFNNQLMVHYIPLIFKKRLFVIDKVSKNAQINLRTGFDIFLGSTSDNVFFTPPRISQGSPAQQFFYEIDSKNNPLIFETGLELKGNVSKKLEVGIYGNLIFQKPKALSNNFRVIYGNGQEEISNTYLNGLSINFGLEIIINSPTYRSFKSISE